MLFQMMDRLHAEVARGDLSAVHFEDPVASAAVATLAEAGNAPAPGRGLTRIAFVEFAREIAALPAASDASNERKCVELMKKAEGEFEQLQAQAEPALLEGARKYAARFTCTMHPEMI